MKRLLNLTALLLIMLFCAIGSDALTIPAGKLFFDNSKTGYSIVKFVFGSDTRAFTRIITMTDEGDNLWSVTIPEDVNDMYRYTFAETSLDDGDLEQTFSTTKDYISNTLNEKRTATSEAAIVPGWVFTPTSGDNWAQGNWLKRSDNAYSGTLPVIFINTTDNVPVTSKETYLTGTYYLDPMGIEGVEGFGTKDSPLPLQIKGRGNYTWTGFDKKPYRLKLDKKAGLMGMPKSKHWGLLAHADDELGFLRNTVGFELSRRLGLAWTPGQAPVEVVLNGDYIGLYMLTELIRVDSDRVNIVEQADNETDPLNITGGWLVEIDNYDEDEQVRITEGNGEIIRFTYKTPEQLSTEQRQFLTDLVNNLNSAIYIENKQNNVWENYVDVETLAKFYIIQEIMDNAESFHGSCYWHRERGIDSKIMFGPVWDFGNSYRRSSGKFIYQDPPFGQTWIGEIAKFPHFQEVVTQIWKSFLAYDFDGMTEFIDRFEQQIAGAAPLDAERWPQYGSRNFDNAGSQFKSTFNARINWLKDQWGKADVVNAKYDVNKDTNVNVGDVATVYGVILNPNAQFADRSDVNDDGTTNVGDVASIYNVILGGNNNDDDDLITIYVKADEAPHLYAWTDNGQVQIHNGDWPGEVMAETATVEGVTYFVKRFDLDNLNIIFNNGNAGSGNQTEDIRELSRGVYYFTYDGADQYTKSTTPGGNVDPDPEPDPEPDQETLVAIYVQATDAPHLYVWTSNGRNTQAYNGDWPGEVMTETAEVDGITWWVQKFDLDNINIIFNNGGYGVGENQTENIEGLERGAHFFTYDGFGTYTVVN